MIVLKKQLKIKYGAFRVFDLLQCRIDNRVIVDINDNYN